MTIKWRSEQLADTLKLSWSQFEQKYPRLCSIGTYYNVRRDPTTPERIAALQAELNDRTQLPLLDPGSKTPLSVVPAFENLFDFLFSTKPEQRVAELFPGAAKEIEKIADEQEVIPTSESAEGEPVDREQQPYEMRGNSDEILINWRNRTIVTDLGEFGSVVFSFERHAEIRRRYADDWENTRGTLVEVARDFEMQPKALERYLRVHSIRHASDPFTDEEWKEGLTPEEAVERTMASHRLAFHKRLQKEKWKTTIENADKWLRFEQTVIEPLMASIKAQAPRYTPPRLNLSPNRRAFDVVLHMPDVHYGKAGWADEVGEGYSREEASRLVLSKTERTLQQLTMYGQPGKIIMAIGSDWFHIDTDAMTTTEGTRQDMDGNPYQVLWEGSELAIKQIDMARQVAPVDVYYVPGNHDRMQSFSLMHSVYAWFHNAPDVKISRGAAPRQYLVSGDTLIGFAHGDGAKPKDLPLLMASEARAPWGNTRWRAFFTGHLHFELTRDTMGVIQYQLPSLSGQDRWHARNGYVGSRRAAAAYVVDATEGIVGTVYSPVVEGEN